VSRPDRNDRQQTDHAERDPLNRAVY
jgi:hypothetical protein